MIYSVAILIWQFGEFPKGLQIKCTPFIMQTWPVYIQYSKLSIYNTANSSFEQIAKYFTHQ